jgi:hypothetical protein
MDKWLMPIHIAGGSIAIIGGYVAVFAKKGGNAHRKFGLAFVVAMMVLATTATAIATLRGQGVGGTFVLYLVVTAFTTVRPLRNGQRLLDLAGLAVAVPLLVLGTAKAIDTWVRYGAVHEGVPTAMSFFLMTILALAVVGDIRVLRSGPLTGSSRIARHLWRMCFSLFVATGSFFLGQADELPDALRVWPALYVLALAPLPLLLYWMARVKRKALRGMIVKNRATPTTTLAVGTRGSVS